MNPLLEDERDAMIAETAREEEERRDYYEMCLQYPCCSEYQVAKDWLAAHPK